MKFEINDRQITSLRSFFLNIYIYFILYQICLSDCDRDLLKLASQREEDIDQYNWEDQ